MPFVPTETIMLLLMALVLVIFAGDGGIVGAVPLEEDRGIVSRVIRQQPTYGITHLDIRDAILTLDKSIKSLDNKLTRHEAREAQVADYVTKTLNALNTDHSNTQTNIQTLAHQLAKMEERMLSMEALIQTTDERQRMILNRMTEGLDRLLAVEPELGAAPGSPEVVNEGPVTREMRKLTRKVNQVDSTLQREVRKITNQVKIVGESMDQHMGQLQERHERLANSLDTCEAETTNSLQQLTASLAQTSIMLQEQLQGGGGSGGNAVQCPSSSDVTNRLDALDRLYREQEEELHDLTEQTHKSLDDQLATLKMLIDESHVSQAIINASVANLTQNLRLMDDNTHDGLQQLSLDVQTAVEDGTDVLSESVSALAADVKVGTGHIMDTLDDTASQAENLQNTVLENYSQLSEEIGSLKKVEQVMINTADAVLDTKRSIEFGIQQIIFELGDIVKNSGSTINTTLSDQISNISFAILKNQTSALTNMTEKMEKEISQVWRQIGIMYHQMTQSVDLLDQLQNTTRTHMNASLSRVGDMDGTVGQISTKVADVENNLNYLLGRLSLVVSEFNLMKSGVGEELLRLKENMANRPVHFAGGEPSSESRYDVNRKRHAIHPEAYPGHDSQPLSLF